MTTWCSSVTRTLCLTRSRSSSPASDGGLSLIGCWRPCSSPTSLDRGGAPPSLATAGGAISSSGTTPSCDERSVASGGERWTRQVTGSWRRSTVQHGRSGVPARSPTSSRGFRGGGGCSSRFHNVPGRLRKGHSAQDCHSHAADQGLWPRGRLTAAPLDPYYGCTTPEGLGEKGACMKDLLLTTEDGEAA